MTHQMIPVEFHGDTLLAVDVDGKVFVALRPICRSLGVDWTSQKKRVRRDPVLSKGGVMMTSPSPGGDQDTLCLPLDMLNGWLFGISATRCRPEIRDRLIAYQRECYRVLFEHFQPTVAEPEMSEGRSSGEVSDMLAVVPMVRECRLLWGKAAGQALWMRLGLPFPPSAGPAVAGDADVGGVAAYLLDRTVAAPGSSVGASALYQDYATWCAIDSRRPVTQTAFGRRLAGLGVAKSRSGVVRYLGISLVERAA